MKLTEKYLNLFEADKSISKKGLDDIEKLLDKLFSSLKIDVEFTKHFFDRINDARNGKQITLDELARLYIEVFKKFGKKISELPDDAEATLKDINTSINVPFVLDLDKEKGLIELRAVTIMRKKDFKTRNKIFKVASK
jgi:hypothetical protein